MDFAKKKMFLLDLAIAGFGVILDQATKKLAVLHLKNQPDIPIIRDVFELHYLENHGAAFGFLQNQKPFFVVMTLLVLACILYVIWKMPSEPKYRLIHVMCGVLTAGAIGNFIDRLRFDYVIDFLYFKLINFPVFNVADIYVSLTCIVGVLLVFWGPYKEEDFAFLKRPSLSKK